MAIVCAANLQGVLCIHAPNGRVLFQEGEGLGKEEKGLATPWLAASSCLRNLHEIRFWGRFILFWGDVFLHPPCASLGFAGHISCHVMTEEIHDLDTGGCGLILARGEVCPSELGGLV